MDKSELERILGIQKIDWQKWGTGDSKTVDHLLNEINTGESILNGIIRFEKGVNIDVYYRQKETIWKLIEEKQVFTDGRVKRRNLSTSIGEKMKPGESPLETAARGMREELGIIGVAFASLRFEDQPLVPSTSFPGLFTKRNVFFFETTLSAEQYNPEGYREIQADKTNYFIWIRLLTQNNV
jgi:hypothetical protein